MVPVIDEKFVVKEGCGGLAMIRVLNGWSMRCGKTPGLFEIRHGKAQSRLDSNGYACLWSSRGLERVMP
jgi:hypothetical protein